MSQSQVEKLFRIDSISTTRGTDGEHGTGLGLILCKDYIELNQGKITVDSRLNSGTTLQFICLARLSHKLRCLLSAYKPGFSVVVALTDIAEISEAKMPAIVSRISSI